jgi:hypothetical protein
MKASKRSIEAQKRAQNRKRHGKPGAGESKYARKQAIDNRPGSPIRTKIVTAPVAETAEDES